MPLVRFLGLGSSAYLYYFRVSRRASQVSRLRAEFDQGIDYNLVESDPCDSTLTLYLHFSKLTVPPCM